MKQYLIFAALVQILACQERSSHWPSSYGIWPYMHVYPPVDTRIDQKTCEPDAEYNHTCPLFIQLITSFGGSFISSGVIPAVQLALDQINARTDLLPGYSLHYTLLDSQCDHTMSLDALHTGLLSPPTKIAVMGSGCSVATEPAAEISHYYNLTQVSCTSASIELSNRRRFRRHFQHFPADISLAYGFFGIIEDSKWRKVTLVVQDEFLFTRTIDELKKFLVAKNVTFHEVRYTQSTDLFADDDDSRIYILSMYPPFARQVLCKAYQKNENFKYPHNLFIINGWFPDNWWLGPPNEQQMLEEIFDCTADQRKSLVPYTLSILSSGMVVVNYSAISDNGITGEEMTRLYSSYFSASKLNITEVFLFQLCYDATWTLAKALNKTITDLSNDSDLIEKLNPFKVSSIGNFGLQHFDYSNDVIANNIHKHLSKTNFTGIVGNISFNENGSRRVDSAEIRQFRFQGNTDVLRPILIGRVHWDQDNNFAVKYHEDIHFIWPEGLPYDGVPTESIVTVHLAITVVIVTVAVIGTMFTLMCQTFNIYFRKKRVIRLSSPYLNIFIGIGAIMIYLSMCIGVAPSLTSTSQIWLCNMQSWLFAIGYSLSYGTIVAKMCRVYYIFSNPTTDKRPMKDWKLALYVLFLVVVDMVILSTYSLVEGLRGRLSPSRIPNQEKFEETRGKFQETFHFYIFVCNSSSRYITLGVLYGYKVLLQIVALVLAISIRKVQIKGLNDAKYIMAAIYVTSIVTTLTVVSTYTTMELPNVFAVLFSLCQFVGTTVILILVFMPPIVDYIKDPEGKNVFKEKCEGCHVNSMLSEKDGDSIEALKLQIQQLEQTLLRQMVNNKPYSTNAL